MEELLYRVWFLDLRISNQDKIILLSLGKNLCELYNFSVKDYINMGINLVDAEEIQRSKPIEKYESIVDYIGKEKIKLVLIIDEQYPESLKYIYNPPVGFFYKGVLKTSDLSIAVVGSRRASEYGKTAAYQISSELGKRGITVVSGLARGIDGCAHRGCMDSHGYTIGVIGNGFKNIYPVENKQLYEEISKNGCIITEHLPDVKPFPQNFPARNRIISGLSKFVLVIEAGERSGSLITAHLALEQGKDVFAVPGNIYSPNSKGTNKMIKDGAKPILNIEDILEEFDIEKLNKKTLILNDVERTIVDLLDRGAMSFNDICENSGLQIDILLSAISRLECTGIIKKTYGNYYIIG